jgi:tetratricopeptide (TPR) repeat protein
MSENAEQLRQEMLRLLEASEASQAVALGMSALNSFPADSKLTMLYGISLEQVGRIDEATVQLRRATELAPTDPEPFHNLAVALCNMGDYHEAATYAEEALRLDPEHEGALGTLEMCRAKGSIPFESESEPIQPTVETIRQGIDDKPVHLLHLGDAWTKIGFGVTGYCVFSFAFLIFHPFFDGKALKHDPLSILAFLLYVTSGIAAVFWTLIDVIDRREKFVWLLPMWVCGFMAIPALPLSLYLAIRRKLIQIG